MTDQNDLLDIIDELTKPTTVTNWQHEHIHTWVNLAGQDEEPVMVCEFEAAHARAMNDMLVRHEQDALLDWLQKAVSSSVGRGSGGGKAARERTPLDVSAFTLLEDIDGRVRSWMLDFGETRGDLKGLLRAWYVKWRSVPREESDERRHFSIVSGWRQRIVDLMDSPTPVEITSPCPACGQLWVTRGFGVEAESIRALWAIWRERPEDSQASCQGCGKTWHGISQMRSLRIAIDESEADTPVVTLG